MTAMLSDLTYVAQFEALRAWVGTLQTTELQSPSVLPGWTVAELIGDSITAISGAFSAKNARTDSRLMSKTLVRQRYAASGSAA